MKRSPMPARKTGLKATTIRASGKRKARSKAMKAHMSRVAEMGCIACLIAGTPGTQPELHHPRTDAGVGQKAPDSDVIPLCHAHHRGTQHPRVPSIHLDRLNFIETFGSEAELLARVRKQLAERGE
jgi:hypothetical protein